MKKPSAQPRAVFFRFARGDVAELSLQEVERQLRHLHGLMTNSDDDELALRAEAWRRRRDGFATAGRLAQLQRRTASKHAAGLSLKAFLRGWEAAPVAGLRLRPAGRDSPARLVDWGPRTRARRYTEAALADLWTEAARPRKVA